MSELRYLTAGESHGRALTTILEGMPAGVAVTEDDINKELARRQKGYGRGARMAIEADKVQVSSGIRWGETLGSPITMQVFNKDWAKWEKLLSVDPKDRDESKRVIKPRPGHADLVGLLKYDRQDAQDILDRASARETAARVAVGAVCRKLLEPFGIQIFSFVREIGTVKAKNIPKDPAEIVSRAEASEVRCPDPDAEKAMKELIDKAKADGDTLGGVFSVIITGCPVGLGSHVHWDRKLEGRLCWAMMSIQAMKGVEIGMGFEASRRFGSEVHDEIFYSKEKGFYRGTNNAGGFEGGMTTGEPIVISVAKKPISTLMKPLRSVNIETKEPFKAEVIRSDVVAVPAAGVAAEAIAAFEIALAMRDKFAGDSLREMKDNYSRYLEHVRSR
jgi:chorismate synthase